MFSFEVSFCARTPMKKLIEAKLEVLIDWINATIFCPKLSKVAHQSAHRQVVVGNKTNENSVVDSFDVGKCFQEFYKVSFAKFALEVNYAKGDHLKQNRDPRLFVKNGFEPSIKTFVEKNE